MQETKQEEKHEATEIYDTKEYYTIEDLVDITKILDRITNEVRNANSDIRALESSIERLTKKADNAKKYIDEIEEHKKSIFEFWSFVNQDSVLRIK